MSRAAPRPAAGDPSAASLWEAAFWADEDGLRRLLAQPNVQINVAVGSGSGSLAKLSGGAIGPGDTGFHITCSKGYASCAQLLVAAGCDTSVQNASGLTGWDLAERYFVAEGKPNHGKLLKLLDRLADSHELLDDERSRTGKRPHPAGPTEASGDDAEDTQRRDGPVATAGPAPSQPQHHDRSLPAALPEPYRPQFSPAHRRRTGPGGAEPPAEALGTPGARQLLGEAAPAPEPRPSKSRLSETSR